MSELTTVVMTDPRSGGVGLLLEDGSYVWAEQLDNKALRIGQRLVGRMDAIGIERLNDQEADHDFDVFIQAYGLGFEALKSVVGGNARD